MNPWPVVSLGSLAKDIFVGLPTPRNDPLSSAFVSVGDLRQGELAPSAPREPRERVDARYHRYLLRPDDVLLTARGTVMKVALVRGEGLIANNTLMVIRPAPAAGGEFLYAALVSIPLQQALARLSRGSTAISAWRVQDVAALDIPYPPSAVREQLAALVQAEARHYLLAAQAAEARRSAMHAALAVRLYSDAELT